MTRLGPSPTYVDFLDGVLRQEVEAKQRTRIAMGLEIAHFPTVKTLDGFDLIQPSLDHRLVCELATSHFLAPAENVLILRCARGGQNAFAIASATPSSKPGRRPTGS